jgi:hypothetical protein
MAEKELVYEKYNGQTLDCLFVIEKAMRHFYIRAETGKAVGRSPEQIDRRRLPPSSSIGQPSGSLPAFTP